MEFLLEEIDLPDTLTIDIFKKTIEQSVYMDGDIYRSKWKYKYYLDQDYKPYEAIVHAIFSSNSINECFVHNGKLYKVVKSSLNSSGFRMRRGRFATVNVYFRKNMTFSLESKLLEKVVGKTFRFEEAIRSNGGSITHSRKKYGLLVYYRHTHCIRGHTHTLLWQQYYDAMKDVLNAKRSLTNFRTANNKVVIFHNDPNEHVTDKFYTRKLI